jgi:adenylate cyclase
VNKSIRPELRLLRLVAVVVAAVTFTLYLEQIHLFDTLENDSYGQRLEVSFVTSSAAARKAQRSIRLVTIDDSTYARFAGHSSSNSEIPRPVYAALIRRLSDYGAKVITFDILFDSPSFGDNDLAQAIRRSGRVVLACGDSGYPAGIIHPLPIFQRAGCYLGHTRVSVPSSDPEISAIEPVIGDGPGELPALSVEAVRVSRNIQAVPISYQSGHMIITGVPLITASDGSMKIHYVGSDISVFSCQSFESLINPTPARDLFYRSYYSGAIVLVGDVTRDHGDLKLSPVGLMPGVGVNANAIATILSRDFIRDTPTNIEAPVMALLASLTALLISVRRLVVGACLALVLLVGYAVTNFFLFCECNIDLQLAAPAALIVITALCLLTERSLTEESEKSRMRSLLQRFVNPKIADYLILHPELIGAQGKRVKGTVLFTDIRGFTSMSERLTPEELVQRMDEYFGTVLDIIFRHDGTAISIAGDAMLGVFGVPVAVEGHASHALLAALEIKSAVLSLSEKWKSQDDVDFNVGIGINTGEMVVGEVGGKHLRNFSVYGLQVNIASRIEQVTKQRRGAILISRATRDAANGEFFVVGPIFERIKGVAEPVEIYEVHEHQVGGIEE